VKYDLTDTTFTIPVRVDMRERGLCLCVVVGCLFHYLDTNVIILEDDTEQKVPSFLSKEVFDRCVYVHRPTGEKLFHRTRWLNEMAKLAKTPIIVNQDADLSCKPEWLVKARDCIVNGETKFSTPYNGIVHYYHGGIEKRFMNKGYDFDYLDKERKANTGTTQVGGVVFSDKQKFVEIGMENENFVSWGFEDDDRMHRMMVLGGGVKRLGGELYHFHHPRNFNSDYSNPHLNENVKEREKVLGLSEEALRAYVQTWSWRA